MKKLLFIAIAFVFFTSIKAQTSSAYSQLIACSQPSAAPTTTQSSCTNAANAFDLGLTFNPPTPVPGYTITWSIVPNGVFSATQTAASGGIAPGTYNATITAAGGCSTTTSFSINPLPAQAAFSLVPNATAYMISCYQPTVTINLNPATYNYTWTNGVSPTQNGSTGNFNSSHIGTWTVTGSHPTSGCSSTQTFVVYANTVTPSSTVSPLTQSIACTPGSYVTFTATSSPTANISQTWQSPYSPGSVLSSGYNSIYSVSGVGVFTNCVTNAVNGCSTCKTVSVVSVFGYPAFSAISSSQFLLGCGNNSISSITFTNAVSTPTGSTLSFTLLPPSFSGPSYGLGSATSYTANVPGQYTVIAKDINSNCETKIPISIVQNTVGPNINVSVATQTLSCFTPSVILQASSTNTGVTYSWSFPGPGTATTSAVTVSTIPTATFTGNYSLSVTGTNACASTTVIPFYQNINPPNANISPSGSPVLTCITPSINLTNSSVSTIPPSFPHPQPVAAIAWYGPAPQASLANTSVYVASTPGVYTMVAQDQNNGCKTTAIKTVMDNRVFPVITSSAPFNINCPVSTATIFPTMTGPTTGFTYSWAAPPTATISTLTQSTTIVNMPGDYTITVTNPATSCSTTSIITVAVCAGLNQNTALNNTISVYPNPSTGLFVLDTKDNRLNSIIEIYSVTGILIKKQAITADKTTVSLENEANGLYFIYIKEGEKARKVAKIVKN